MFVTKKISKSILKYGIPLSFEEQKLFQFKLESGEKRSIQIFYRGRSFDATLRSVGFNREKEPNHVPIWRIEYRRDLKDLLASSRDLFLTLESSTRNDLFLLETYAEIETQRELEIEHALEDETATTIERLHLTKFRRLNREIGNQLKTLYNFRCQICGRNFGLDYGTNLVEAHHIEFFSKSLNNDAANLMIVCPNHHRVIHATNPFFDRAQKLFRYSNGFSESLTLNYHL